MASTWSNAELRLMTTGENDNTWGDQTNDNLKRLSSDLYIRRTGGPMPKDWRDENLWPSNLPDGVRPWVNDPDFYEYPGNDPNPSPKRQRSGDLQ